MSPIIHVSAVVLRDPEGRVLLVRKRGTHMWMNPGGKPEAGESPAECASRELREELGLELEPSGLRALGRFAAPAANEDGFSVVADVLEWPHALVSTPKPAAEIEAVRWCGASELDDASLAPLFVQAIAPRLSTGAAGPSRQVVG